MTRSNRAEVATSSGAASAFCLTSSWTDSPYAPRETSKMEVRRDGLPLSLVERVGVRWNVTSQVSARGRRRTESWLDAAVICVRLYGGRPSERRRVARAAKGLPVQQVAQRDETENGRRSRAGIRKRTCLANEGNQLVRDACHAPQTQSTGDSLVVLTKSGPQRSDTFPLSPTSPDYDVSNLLQLGGGVS